MSINHNKEKFQNAITFFLNHTSWSGKKKIYKLLFILDFEHFKQTGRSVTGFNYFAWRMGPVPAALDEAIENEYDEITEKFEIENQIKGKYRKVYLIPKTEFDNSFFTRRELRLLREISERFAMSSGDDMVWFTHRDTEPWYRVWEIENRKMEKIPYEYALEDLDENDRAVVLEIASEREAFIQNYR